MAVHEGERSAASSDLDLIAVGRSCVDLYGQQIGGRLEDMASFAKYLGGSPANTAVGAARLGLRSALITRVGDDHMGRFVREQLAREGVDTTGVRTDPDRLTALVLLGISDPDTFPLIFYRENCADMALSVDDMSSALIARAASVLINGTHLSNPCVRAASVHAAQSVKARGGRVIFDIDYRPVLWGLAAKDMGEDRFVASAEVTAILQSALALCDLVVGTEEEIHILGGSTDTATALRTIRALSDALLVLKRGPLGCIAFPGAIADDLGEGIAGKGFSVDVFNVLGAGDAFMAGFLRGWLRGEDIATCCTWANACGAIVVSRHGCAPAAPTWRELQLFLSRHDWPHRLRESRELAQLHWSSTRGPSIDNLMVLAIDHRSQFEELAAEAGSSDTARVAAFKSLAFGALGRVAREFPDVGILADDRFGARVLEQAACQPYWIGRPIERPGSRPLQFEGSADLGTTLREWPVGQVVKCLVYYHPDDPPAIRADQDEEVQRLFAACRAAGHELLLEVIASRDGPVDHDTVATVIDHFYDLDVFPDWWKLEPTTDARAWRSIEAVIARRDPDCRGIMLLGLSAPIDELLASFSAAGPFSMIKGFAVGRSIWREPARLWLAANISDAEATDMMADNFRALVVGWNRTRRDRAGAA